MMSMLRQSSNRNQRAQGFKLKHTLQICVLVAICIWLLYQVKHSHDKKKALEESNSKIVINVDESQLEIFRINRKDLPQISETDTTSETHNEEEENEEGEEAEQETKQEEVEDGGGRGDGSDEIDEQDQERADEEAERGEFADEEEKGGQAEELDIVEKADSDMGSQEAREESFKGDDASSAVFEGNRKLEVESNEESRSSDEEKVDNMEGKEVEAEEDSRNLSEEKVENVEGNEAEEDSRSLSEEKVETMERKEETQNTDIVMNETVDTSEVNDSSVVDEVDGSNGLNVTLGEKETISSGNLTMGETGAETGELDDGSISNLTLVDSHDQLDQQINLTTATASNDQAELQSNTTTVSAENQMEGQINMVTDGDLLQNVSVILDSPPHNVSTSLESVQNQNDTAEIETSVEDASNSESVVTEQTEQSNTSSNLEESRENITTSSAVSDNVDVAQGEAGDSSQNLVTEEEKETHTDLSVLPADQNEVKSVEEVAAE